MIYRVYFTVKGKQYVKSFKTMDDAQKTKQYVRKRGATDIEIRVMIERKSNENV